jgi:hypothetical protein
MIGIQIDATIVVHNAESKNIRQMHYTPYTIDIIIFEPPNCEISRRCSITHIIVYLMQSNVAEFRPYVSIGQRRSMIHIYYTMWIMICNTVDRTQLDYILNK